MEASSIFSPVVLSLFSGLSHRHLIFYVFNPFDILGVFGRQILLRLAGGFALQGHDSVFGVNIVMALTLRWNKSAVFTFALIHPSEFSAGVFAFDFQSVVHAFYARQARHGLLCQ